MADSSGLRLRQDAQGPRRPGGMWVDCPACGRGVARAAAGRSNGRTGLSPRNRSRARRAHRSEKSSAALAASGLSSRNELPNEDRAALPTNKVAENLLARIRLLGLASAMIPLAIETFAPHESDIDRLIARWKNIRDQAAARSADEIAQRDEDEVLAILPGIVSKARCFARDVGPWLMALVSGGNLPGDCGICAANFPARP